MIRIFLLAAALLAVSACATRRDANVWTKYSAGVGEIMKGNP